MPTVTVEIRRLPHTGELPLPAYDTPQSAGMDLAAAVTDDVVLAPGARAMIPTGLAIALPQGFEAQVRPRSGLAARNGLTVLNSPGTIDADYRGEIKVILINLGAEPVTFARGDRVAQLVVQRLPDIEWEAVDELAATRRGAGGFGHTGDR